MESTTFIRSFWRLEGNQGYKRGDITYVSTSTNNNPLAATELQNARSNVTCSHRMHFFRERIEFHISLTFCRSAQVPQASSSLSLSLKIVSLFASLTKSRNIVLEQKVLGFKFVFSVLLFYLLRLKFFLFFVRFVASFTGIAPDPRYHSRCRDKRRTSTLSEELQASRRNRGSADLGTSSLCRTYNRVSLGTSTCLPLSS
jgi:hypothetical protein